MTISCDVLVIGAGIDSYNSYAQRGSFHVIGRQDDIWIRASQFKHSFLQMLASLLGNRCTGAFGTGQGYTLNNWVGNERRDLLVGCKDILVDAFWDASFVHHALDG